MKWSWIAFAEAESGGATDVPGGIIVINFRFGGSMNRPIRRRLSTCSISVLAAALCVSAAPAQESEALSDANGGGDIVVTATRTEQPLSRVPISVTALSQERMDRQGFRSFADIARVTPGVQFSPQTGKIVIRGIDGSNAGAGTVGIYIDDTPIQVRTIGSGTTNVSSQIFDLERVEVLRGPQGTLFGAGSEGGTVRFITPQPSLDKLDVYGRGEVSFTEHGDPSAEAGIAVGAPIVTDKIGFRVSAWQRHQGGFIDRVDYRAGRVLDANADSVDSTVIRAAVTFKPTHNITITPSVLYQRNKTNDSSVFTANFSDPGEGEFRSISPTQQFVRDRYVMPVLRVNFESDFVNVVYNGSYFDRSSKGNTDYTILLSDLFGFSTRTGPSFGALPGYFTNTDIINKQKNVTQELRFQSGNAESPLQWVVGLFYQRNKQNNQELQHDPQYYDFVRIVRGRTPTATLVAPDFSYAGNSNAQDTQYAAFGELSYSVTDRLKLTVGGRYAKTKLKFNSLIQGPYQGVTSINRGSTSETPLTPKFGVSYQADNSNLFYASASKGYRPGAASATIPGANCLPDLVALGRSSLPDHYNSDSVWSYEVGSKNSLFGNRVRLATSAYLINWSDIQQRIPLPTCAFSFTTNVGKARSKGFDIQADINLFKGFNLGVMLGYTDAKFSETISGGQLANGTVPVIIAKGDTIGVPPWTLTVSGDYRFDAWGQNSYIRADYSLITRNKDLRTQQNPVTTSYDATFYARPTTSFVTARMGTELGPVDASIFVDNLFDTAKILTSTHNTRSSPIFSQTVYRPRTAGVTLVYRY